MNRRIAEEWANAVFDMWLQEAYEHGHIPIAPPPTRAEVVKHVWGIVRDLWMESNIDGKLTVQTDPTEEIMVFEIIRYDRFFVIECDGVVVEKLPVIG